MVFMMIIVNVLNVYIHAKIVHPVLNVYLVKLRIIE